MKILKKVFILLIVLSMAFLVACNQKSHSENGSGSSQQGSFETPIHPFD